MIIRRFFWIVFSGVLLLMYCSKNSFQSQAGHQLTYTNPIDNITEIGDPCMIKYDGQYYLYATSAPDIGFRVWESPNMIDWEPGGLAFSRLNSGNGWGEGSFWAPEVVYYQERFYMIYSARASDGHLKIALASSESPLGPFVNLEAPLFDRGSSFIDGHIFFDGETPYIYYVKDCSENIIDGKHVSQIYAQRLSSDLRTLLRSPSLVIQPSQAWEGMDEDWQWNEGPYVLKHNERYYLTYSANGYFSPEYAIGYATASNPFGPWIKYPGNPILSKDPEKGVSGPGHNVFVRSPDGSELFIVYHTHTDPDNPGGNRTVNIDRTHFAEDTLVITGPTRNPQPVPAGITWEM